MAKQLEREEFLRQQEEKWQAKAEKWSVLDLGDLKKALVTEGLNPISSDQVDAEIERWSEIYEPPLLGAVLLCIVQGVDLDELAERKSENVIEGVR